ncbi:hypothetical protein OU798_12980 [Prolixibacteraceae bacterium Z1-6]|uniref:Uncharacterized protein n=1 Tax=Draconibacterium aestuarii TaxID=2998507 RepID=A0A9X3FDY6_9BACT|nr:hypothetical protein [Prolixibacteraceae bacterium Z1-6]
MASNKDLLVADLYLKAVLPVLKVIIQDDPKTARKFENITAHVIFRARHEDSYLGANLYFNKGKLSITEEPLNSGDLIFTFGSVKKMNTFLAGGLALPSIKGLFKFKLLTSFISTLLLMKLMMPDARPKDEQKKYLKVKMALYMVTTALSKLNKSGDLDMTEWTGQQPDRIYQLSVDDTDIAAYLRVKAGKTKSGRGFYQRKRPFVHMRFNGVDNALKVLLKDAEFVEAVDNKYICIEGSPEYAANINDFMMRIQALTT